MAQWIRRLTTNQEIPGSSPGKLVFFQLRESSLGLSHCESGEYDPMYVYKS